MNANEYRQWHRALTQAFPEVLSRFELKDASVEPWERALADTPLQHALDAIDAIVRGDIAKPEYGWSDLPRIVRMYAFTAANAELQAETRGDWNESDVRENCRYCHDTGFAIIWNPLFVADRSSNILLCEDRYAVIQLHREWKSDQKRHDPKRVRGCGSLSMAVACCCEHPIAKVKMRQIAEWESKGKPREKTPQPCYVYRSMEWHTYERGEPGELE